MSTKKARQSQADRSEATRGELIRVARALFAKHGYAAVGTEEIVKKARVTRGALYHHFRDKTELFEAVVEAAMADLHGRIATAAGSSSPSDPWSRLCAGIDAFLDASGQGEVLRIALLDAPSVLGWARWRELDAKFGLGLLERGLEAAILAGQIHPQSTRVTAHLLLAVLGESAMLLARADQPAKTRTEIRETLERVLAGIRGT